MSKFIKVSRSDMLGSYVQRPSEVVCAVEADLDDIDEVESGTVFSLEVVEMTEQVYESLPEFIGW